MKNALQRIVNFLRHECGEEDMASVKINSQSDCYLSVGVCRDDPRMGIDEFATLIENLSTNTGE